VPTLPGSFEGQPDGTAFTVANSDDNGDAPAQAVTLNSGTAVYSTAEAMWGTSSLALTRSSTNTIFVTHDLGAPAASGKFRRWIRLTGSPSSTADFPFRFTTGADATQATIQMTTGRVLRISAGSAVQGTVALALNTWYRIEIQWINITGGSGIINLQAYVGNSETLHDSVSLTGLTLSAFQRVRTGNLSSGAPSVVTYFDDHPSGFLSDADSTPFGPVVLGPDGPAAYYVDDVGELVEGSWFYVDDNGELAEPASITWVE
jgi:hypothetical protein